MKVIVSGLTASGKSSLSKEIASILGMEYFSASSKLREILPKKDFKVWESKKGIEAVRFRLNNPKYDRKLDSFIVGLFKKSDSIVMDSWVAAWKINDKDTVKIYIKADRETRTERVSKRDNISLKDASAFMGKKDKLTAAIYKKIYNIDIGQDLTPFDLVVDTSHLAMEDTLRICLDFISFRKE